MFAPVQTPEDPASNAGRDGFDENRVHLDGRREGLGGSAQRMEVWVEETGFAEGPAGGDGEREKHLVRLGGKSGEDRL